MCASYRKVTIILSCICPFSEEQLDDTYVRTSHSREYHINTQKLINLPGSHGSVSTRLRCSRQYAVSAAPNNFTSAKTGVIAHNAHLMP